MCVDIGTSFEQFRLTGYPSHNFAYILECLQGIGHRNCGIQSSWTWLFLGVNTTNLGADDYRVYGQVDNLCLRQTWIGMQQKPSGS